MHRDCFVRALALIAVVGTVSSAAAQQPATVPVGTVYAEKKPIAATSDFVGRVDATDRVEIRARVKGYLEAVQFKEGDVVKKGDPLYQIEKGLFQADVEQAQGALERSNAAKTLTAIQLQRAQDLLDKSAGTAVARDQALAADQQAQGAIMADQASLDTAKINLGYTDITSPIAGKISKTNITVGNVVGPDSGVLTLIVSQDPMYVTFPVSQRDLLQTRLSGKSNDISHTKIKIRFANGAVYDQDGTVNFVDVSVDRSTDTVLMRATMANPASTLIDGELVSVTVESATPQEKVVVPQGALIADQEGVYVFAVEGGKAVVKRIKPGGEIGADVVVDSGLNGGEQIVVEGLQSIRPGQPVQAAPVPATIKGN
ncbi:MAG TPA: efflux RND transporter periplasmic adaptor subunit [Xanthobacteraceae bacterium]|jgi:membrane fusion protein (multidrug efflux system)|nr:efflux RND transporter periplasmic adaptor subunit [Xanthobacteraceae bacterium]